MTTMMEYTSTRAFVETVELTMRIINEYPIYGSDGQKNVAEIYLKYLTENGWKCIVDEYSYSDIENVDYVRKPHLYDPFYKDYTKKKKYNVYAILDSKKPGKTLIFNGHFDIDIIDKDNLMRSYQKARILPNNRLIGRGSTDMLSGLNSFATINTLLKEVDWAGKIIFTAVVDEEIGGNGTIRACQYLNENGYLDDVYECIIAEPSCGIKCNESMGFLPFDILITSKVVHMNAQTEKDATEKLRLILNGFAELKKFESLNINVGFLAGGVDPSLPMDKLLVRGICAMRSSISLEELKKSLRDCSRDSEIKFLDLQIEPYKNSKFIGGKLFPSACDAPIFGKFNIPTIVWGPGSLEQAHTENEYIDLSEVQQYIIELHKYIYNCMASKATK